MDPSATIDYSILLHRLATWFGFDGKVTSWHPSYLSSRRFIVTINSTSSTQSSLGQAARKDQSSVLAYSYFTQLDLIVLSNLTHPSVIICMLMTTNLFIYFVTSEFSVNILRLHAATVDLVSQWMSANILSLNQFKTEFLLIGLPAQLPQNSDPCLLMPSNTIITPTPLARYLGVILILHSLCPIKFPQFLNLVSYPSVTSAE